MPLNSLLMKGAWAIQKNLLVAVGLLVGIGVYTYESGRTAGLGPKPNPEDVAVEVAPDKMACGAEEQPLQLRLSNQTEKTSMSYFELEVEGFRPDGMASATRVRDVTLDRYLPPGEAYETCLAAPSERWFNGVDFDEIVWQVRVTKVKR